MVPSGDGGRLVHQCLEAGAVEVVGDDAVAVVVDERAVDGHWSPAVPPIVRHQQPDAFQEAPWTLPTAPPRSRAEALLSGLAEQGVVAVATSFVDNAGHLPGQERAPRPPARLAAWGVGFSTAFDYFRFDDWVAAPASGAGPVGDQRIVPDLDRLVVLAAQPGWAWAPGERFAQDGHAVPARRRLLLGRARRRPGDPRTDGPVVRSRSSG